MDSLSVREFALKEKLSLGSVYRRLWQGQLNARKEDGRWVIVASDCRPCKADSLQLESERSERHRCAGSDADANQ